MAVRAVVFDCHFDDVEVEVGEWLKDAAEEGAYAVGGGRVNLAAHVLAAAGEPAGNGGVDVVGDQRVEVALRYLSRYGGVDCAAHGAGRIGH